MTGPLHSNDCTLSQYYKIIRQMDLQGVAEVNMQPDALRGVNPISKRLNERHEATDKSSSEDLPSIGEEFFAKVEEVLNVYTEAIYGSKEPAEPAHRDLEKANLLRRQTRPTRIAEFEKHFKDCEETLKQYERNQDNNLVCKIGRVDVAFPVVTDKSTDEDQKDLSAKRDIYIEMAESMKDSMASIKLNYRIEGRPRR